MAASSIDPLSLTEAVSDTGQKLAQCVGTAGETGTVVWEPAMATDTDGKPRQLTGAHVKPRKTQVLTGPGNGQAVITGLTIDEAETLSAQLNSGSLPVPVTLINIGPTQ